MVVNVGESQIFKGEMAQAVDGGVWRKRALADLVEKFADGVSVQKELSAVSSQPSANASLD